MLEISYSLSYPQAHVRLDAVSVVFAARRVLTDVSCVVSPGQRIGLIGENGSGKSTLLKVTAGHLTPHAGEVLIEGASGPVSVGLLEQRVPFALETSVHEALESAVSAHRSAASAVDRLGEAMAQNPDDPGIAESYARSLARAERCEAWTIDQRIARMLAGLGLTEVERASQIADLSGGQVARLSLAHLLLQAPDVLLLDEPTNHLDDDAVEYLTHLLLRWKGPVLFASHDRAFLDDTATGLLDLDPAPTLRPPVYQDDDDPGSGHGVTSFTGRYSEYLSARSQARVRWERQYRDEQAQLQRLRATVGDQQEVGHSDWSPRTETRAAKKFYADRNAKVVARRVNDARSRLAELESTLIRRPPDELRFVFPESPDPLPTEGADGVLLTADQLGRAGQLAPLSFSLAPGERLLVTGPNGSGKSTLLRIIAGLLRPTTGHCTIAGGTRVGLLHQDVRIPDPADRGPLLSVAEAYTDLVGEPRATRTPLSTFGLLAPSDYSRPVSSLSLGQQRRLELSILLAEPPDLLLLDEPTNHLSLPVVTELERAVRSYPGGVITVSHDRWLRERWDGRYIAITQE